MLATKPAKLWRPSRTLCDCPVFTAVPLTRVCLCSLSATQVQVRKTIKIGRPGYRVVKQRDPESGQRSLLFEVQYPEIEEGLQPRHRFMGAYEQRVERADKNYQYVMPASAQLRAVFTRCAPGICWWRRSRMRQLGLRFRRTRSTRALASSIQTGTQQSRFSR